MSQTADAAAIPLQDTARLYARHASELGLAVSRVMASGRWLSGPCTAAFARAFAEFCGAGACVPVANGTDALEIAIRALLAVRRIEGDEVVTVANAGGYASAAARLVGLTPVYVDIDPRSQLVDADSLLSALGPRTAVVILTHLYGGAVDVEAIRALMDRRGFRTVPILEDCAQAHGASVRGRRVGSLGDLAAFSFYPTKNLGAMGDGGAVVTSDRGLAEAVGRIHQYGWGQKYRVDAPGGRNSRMDEIQAAVLSALLPHLDDANARRRRILAAYAACAGPAVVAVDAPGAVAHLAVFLAEDRDAFRAHCRDHGVLTDIHYPILDCDQPGWTGLAGRIAPDGLRRSRESVKRIVTLPCFPLMTDDEVARVCDVLRTFREPTAAQHRNGQEWLPRSR